MFWALGCVKVQSEHQKLIGQSVCWLQLILTYLVSNLCEMFLLLYLYMFVPFEYLADTFAIAYLNSYERLITNLIFSCMVQY